MAVVRDFMVRLLADPKQLVQAFGTIRKDGEATFGDKGIGGSLNQMLPSFNKLAIASTAAFAGLAAFGAKAAKAAAEDAAEQEKLATTLRNVTGATDDVIAANEEFLAGLQRTTTFSDSEMRPALATLVAATGDLSEAQNTLRLAQDISISTGVGLTDVASALAKAQNDNFKSLKALSPALADNIKEGQTLEQIFAELSATFGGAAAASAGTLSGQMTILRNSLGEAAENIGAALLPAIQAVVPLVQKFADFAQQNSGVLIALGTAVGTFTGLIIALSATLKIYAIASGIARVATLAFGTAVSATPIGAVLAVISVAAAGIAYFATKTDEATVAQQKFTQALSTTNQWLDKTGGIVTVAGDKFVELTNKMLKLKGELSTTTNQLYVQRGRLEGLAGMYGVTTFKTGQFTAATKGAGAAVKTAAEKLKEYESVTRQAEAAARAFNSSQKQTIAARKNLGEANQALLKAQEELNSAQQGGDPAKIKDAQRQLAAAERNLARAKFDVEEAVFAVADREKELADIRQDPEATPQKIRLAEIALAEAKFSVVDAEDEQIKSTNDLTDARRELRIATDGLVAGDAELVPFLDAVSAAQEAQTQAVDELADATERQADALRDYTDAMKELAAIQAKYPTLAANNPFVPTAVSTPVPTAAVAGTTANAGASIVINTGVGTNGAEAGRQIAELLQQYQNLNPNGSMADFYRQAQVGVLR